MLYDARFRRHMERHTSKSIPQGGKEFNAESHTPCTQIFLSKKKKKIKRIKNIAILREREREMYMNSLFDTCVEITFQRTMFNFSFFLIPLFFFQQIPHSKISTLFYF